MPTSARLKYAHSAPQKMRLVADQIRGKSVDHAMSILAYNTKKAAAIIRKVLASAVANAEHNDGADIDDLKVVSVMVDEGPVMKRLQVRARGRADRITKRLSHVTVIVAEREERVK
jgi:large subunit ribosomal protein L22